MGTVLPRFYQAEQAASNHLTETRKYITARTQGVRGSGNIHHPPQKIMGIKWYKASIYMDGLKIASLCFNVTWHTKSHGKSPFFISESSNNKGFVFIAMLNYQRVSFWRSFEVKRRNHAQKFILCQADWSERSRSLFWTQSLDSNNEQVGSSVVGR